MDTDHISPTQEQITAAQVTALAKDINHESVADASPFELSVWHTDLITIIRTCKNQGATREELRAVHCLAIVVEEELRRWG